MRQCLKALDAAHEKLGSSVNVFGVPLSDAPWPPPLSGRLGGMFVGLARFDCGPAHHSVSTAQRAEGA